LFSKALFASLEGKGGEGLGKRERASERNREKLEGRALGG